MKSPQSNTSFFAKGRQIEKPARMPNDEYNIEPSFIEKITDVSMAEVCHSMTEGKKGHFENFIDSQEYCGCSSMEVTALVSTIVQTALDCGAKGAQYLPVGKVITDSVFRQICEGNGCGKFGRCYMCPPDIGPLDDLIEKIRQFTHAVLYQSVGSIEDSFDFEGMMEAGHAHCMLSQQIRKKLESFLPDHLHLTGGGCHLCERCAKLDSLPCRHPDVALSSLEAYGIDVYRTSLATDLRYINGENSVTFFGIILFSDPPVRV